MTQHCSDGDKPKITYQFNDSQSITIEAGNSPIEILTGEIPNENITENYNPEGYRIYFSNPRAIFGRGIADVVDYKITFYNYGTFNPYTGYYIELMGCGETTFPGADPVSGIRGIKVDHLNVTIDNSTKCPIKNPEIEEKCYLKILNNERILFETEGKCPVSYSVSCSNCPEGFCECSSPAYPGYCCLDCNSTAASIRDITNTLRAKNG